MGQLLERTPNFQLPNDTGFDYRNNKTLPDFFSVVLSKYKAL